MRALYKFQLSSGQSLISADAIFYGDGIDAEPPKDGGPCTQVAVMRLGPQFYSARLEFTNLSSELPSEPFDLTVRHTIGSVKHVDVLYGCRRMLGGCGYSASRIEWDGMSIIPPDSFPRESQKTGKR